MKKISLKKIVPIITMLLYLGMVTINALANILPINGRGTGEMSDSYTNLFAPAGITFSIWGLIYLLLLVYTIYQLSYYKAEDKKRKLLFIRVGIFFSLSSIANSIWIFAWHYDVIWLSFVLMVCILACLISINVILRNEEFSFAEKMLIRLPFTVYLGWITVATIANATTLLVSLQWNRFSLSEIFWTVAIILIGGIIGFLGVLYYRSMAYGVVIIWAYAGIIIKRFSLGETDGPYISVLVAIYASILLLVIGEILIVRKRIKTK